MEIKPKFEINNLLIHKHDSLLGEETIALEVLEITTQTCYAGTQIFYDCRPIHIIKKYGNLEQYRVVHGQVANKATAKYREDELIIAPQGILDIIINKVEAS